MKRTLLNYYNFTLKSKTKSHFRNNSLSWKKRIYSILFSMILVASFTMANAATYYLSPTGNDTSGDGSIGSPWFTLNKAWTVIKAGDTIYLRGGTYEYNSRQTLSGKNGSSGNNIHVFAYPNETPALTKSSSFTTPSWPVTLIYLQGDYTHWKGIEIFGFEQATATIWYGMCLRNSNNNILEQINSHHNGHGLMIRDASTNNLVLNSDFHHNYDPLNNYGDGDGLEVGFLAHGSVNTVRGCRFYFNSDDGIDLWSNDGYVTIENCWSWMNGYREDGVTTGGNGEGIKLGQTTSDYSSEFLRTVRNNLSFYNRNDGIVQNGANCKIYYYNNTIYNNVNRGMEWWTDSFANVVRNNISFGNGNSNYSGDITNATINYNSYHATWQPTGPVASSADFVSIDTTGVSGPRQADGSLPDIDFLKLKSGSDLIDAGTDVGIDYNGTTPDLGAYEYQAAVAKEYTTEEISICEGESYEGWTVSGEYERTLTASSGADSLVTTILTVHPVKYITEDITIYEGGDYLGWTKSGQYERTLTSSTGCDSIVTTNLTVIQTIHTTEKIEICEGGSYEGWTASGEYERILTASSGADSIVTTFLTVNPIEYTTEDITIYEGESYEGWSESGQYERTLTGSTGCDSVVTTNLTVIQTIHTTENIEICEGGSYEGWTASGEYERTLTASSGADSLVTTILTVHPVKYITEDITIYEGGNYLGWTQSGQYERTLTSSTGCDSIVTTNLTVMQNKYTTEDISICEGESYEGWTTSGQYERLLIAATGADSTVITNLTVNPVYNITEDITILKGENYFGWTESGTYERFLTTSTGCDSIVTTNLVVMDHFIPTWWDENGQNHMNFYIADANINGVELEVNDEVAVYDGDLCVGVAKLSTPINSSDESTYLFVKASQDDGSGNGFTSGNRISYRIWDYSKKIEVPVTSVTYKNDVSEWITSGNFVPGGTSVIEIGSGQKEQEVAITQYITLEKGWNIFSSDVVPDVLGMDTVQDKIQSMGYLVKVQDEAGNTYERQNAKDGWINNIGDIQQTEGYKIRVKSDCVLDITGQPVALPLNIFLREGSNLISFPYNGTVDAMKVIQPLIDSGILVKVQDERGNSIEYWGNSLGWINGIGNFNAGEGYLVQVNKNGELPILGAYEKSGLLIANDLETEHFKVDYEGNGTGHMNINITGLDKLDIQFGDEIAAFDGTVCVGTVKISEHNIGNNVVSLNASVSDATTQNGFTEGNTIELKVWDKDNSSELQIQSDIIKGNMLYKQYGSVFVQLKNAISTSINTFDLIEINMFPNPADDQVTVSISNLPTNEKTAVVLSNVAGEIIIRRQVFSSREILNISHLSPGMYFVRTIVGESSDVKKLMVN
ncbi:Por secretion system C-terminal sorting domain-containing protein [Tangfeifania diversioriginum]|uniref:Por secretion system C-terminal sorting domain-containing protein n=1 Tax=Tangfeifania diversioriginum TaxID=1168035 RepID=A0A1M6GTE5_9BACT|nr:T9SS type A sorting domain-containing protein [Tangfeifania diversioriginum]SHJ13190.1 Por secretion system C-terminal sorting domain-containing protein [Tangfeifania diversioriginum]